MKIKVTVYVAVDADGEWNACGWGHSDGLQNDALARELAADPLCSERLYRFEAELEAPQYVTEIKDGLKVEEVKP